MKPITIIILYTCIDFPVKIQATARAAKEINTCKKKKELSHIGSSRFVRLNHYELMSTSNTALLTLALCYCSSRLNHPNLMHVYIPVYASEITEMA